MKPIERILMSDSTRDLFTAMILAVMEDDQVTLGNVEFWIDRTGPWAGEMAFSIPSDQWKGMEEALQARLMDRLSGTDLVALDRHAKSLRRRDEERLRRD